MKRRLLHISTLAGFALAQPLYDVLRRSGEFFVAHRADTGDILLLVLWLSAAVPLLLGLLVWGVGRVTARAADGLTIALVGLFVALIVLPLVASIAGVSAPEALAVSFLHGVLGGLVYWKYAPVREFMTILSPAALVFPLVFLLHPSMRRFAFPADASTDAAAAIPGDTPVVFVVFDQLPLPSILDAHGDIDARHFPGFTALASDAIWYRNATATADFTSFAIPALLSGSYPERRRLPITSDYPHNLFTAFGSRYRIEALESVTDLCPDRFCPEPIEPRWARQVSMLSDISVVYARIVLPEELKSGLPRLTDDWRDFVHRNDWFGRWLTARDQDRRVPIGRFIEGIAAGDPQPTLYFAHVLLPHEPYVYLPDGRRFSTPDDMIGLDRKGTWAEDPWYALQTYRRHLLQVGYVDSLVSKLIAQLKREGLYDRALIVVTSDHGVSFTPGQPMKGLRHATAGEMAAVPLIIKPPHHTGREVSDRNVQAVDVMATLSDLLHAPLPFATAGVSAVGQAPPALEKRVYFADATQTMHLPASLWELVLAAAGRKAELFDGSGHANVWLPKAAPFRALHNQPVAGGAIGTTSDLRLELFDAWRYSQEDSTDDFVPALVAGRISGAAAVSAVPLAIAVNGIIATTTKSVPAPLPSAGAWAALVRPALFRPGINTIDVYEITTHGDRVVLRPALHSSVRPPRLNLILGEARNWDVTLSGFYDREPLGDRVFRWTNGDAEVRLREQPDPQAVLRIVVANLATPQTPLTIAVNECRLFSGTVDTGAWDRSFPLSACSPQLLRGRDVRIRITSGHSTPRPGEPRALGVAIVMVELGRP
jgi:hypothetical protein